MSLYEKLPFQNILEALLDEQKPFPAVMLHRFSDIPKHELHALERVWPQVSAQRKRGLLEDLEALNEADTLLSFHDFGAFTLQDPDPAVRATAIRLLWEEEDEKFVPALLEMIEDDADAQVRATAANALGHYIYLGEIEELAEETLHQIEDRLLAVIEGKDQTLVRRRALESMGFSSRPEVIDLLEDFYRQGTDEWVASALFAMGRSADKRWQRHVLDMMDHPDAEIREEAVRAAGELELKPARQALFDLALEEEEEDVRRAAIWSLSQIGGDGVGKLLDRLLDESEDEEEIELLEDAIENLSFTNDMALFGMLDFDDLDDADLADDESPDGQINR